MWAICGILTAVDYFPPGHPARTDAKIEVVRNAAWIRVPYPGEHVFANQLYMFIITLKYSLVSSLTR